jgi:hypothetical protein
MRTDLRRADDVFWVFFGSILIAWEVWADRTGHMKVSDASYRFPYLIAPWAFIVSLAAHFVWMWRYARVR